MGTSKEELLTHANKLLDDEAEYKKMATAQNPFGDGKASARIVEYLLKGNKS